MMDPMPISNGKLKPPDRTPYFGKTPLKWQLLCLLLIYTLSTSTIALARENVTIDADRQPLAKVLDEISKNTGYHVSINESHLNTPVTIHLQQRPLEEALKRILGQLNHVIIYDDAEKIVKIEIFDPDGTSGDTRNHDRPHRPYHYEHTEGSIENDYNDSQPSDPEELPPDEEVSPDQSEDAR